MRGRLLGLVVVIATLLVVGGLVALTVLRAGADERFAQQDARRVATSTPTQNATSPVASTPVVTLISDEIALDAPPQDGERSIRWPLAVERRLGVDIVSLSTGSSGYLTRPPSASFGGTFEAKASQVAPDSDVVVFFGGGKDISQPSGSLGRAVRRSIERAQAAAPDARIVVIGPPATQIPAASRLIQTRNTIRDAARAERVRFVDPIAQNWLTSDNGVIGDDGASLTEAGQQVVAKRVEAVLAPLLP